MLYTIDRENSVRGAELVFTVNEPMVHYFTHKSVCYIDDSALAPYQPLKLRPFVPDGGDLETLRLEYEEWCGDHLVTGDPVLTRILSDLSYWKEFKQNLLTAKSDTFEVNKCNELYLTSSLGFRINADRRSLTNLNGLIDYFDRKQSSGTVDFKDYDNEMRKLNKEQLQTLKEELIANSDNLYVQKWTKQTEISEADSLDDVRKVSLDFVMLDFTAPE